MKNFCITLAFALSLFTVSVQAQAPPTEKKSYSMVVWADLSFDENAQLSQIQIPERDKLPKPFVTYLMTTIATSTYATPDKVDTIKQFETGLKITLEIDPVTSQAKVLSKEMMPRPTRSEQQSEPIIRVRGEWSGRIYVICSISKNGRCTKPRIDPAANAPEEIAKVMEATLGSWRYLPQKRAGEAIDGEFSTWVTIEADDSAPPTTFDNRI